MFRQVTLLLVAILIHCVLCVPPGQTVNINNWYLTLPIGNYKDPQNIFQPNLNTFESDPYFVSGPGNSIRFRVPIHKQTVTTSGSSYPRTELREMDSSNPSETKVAWTNTDKGVHTMIIDQAITHLPERRNRLAAGQIHDANEFVIIIQLTGSQLFVKTNKNANAKVLDSNYQLGKRFTLKIEGYGGFTYIYYNDMTKPAYSYEYSYKNAYFKAGCYSQSNCDYEQELCTDSSFDNYAEVLIYNLTTNHNLNSNRTIPSSASLNSSGRNYVLLNTLILIIIMVLS